MNLDTKHTTPYSEHILTFLMSRFHCGVLAVLSLSLTSLFIALYWTLKFFDPDVVFNVLSLNQIISRIFLSNIAHKPKHRCWWLEDGQMVRALASTKRWSFFLGGHEFNNSSTIVNTPLVPYQRTFLMILALKNCCIPLAFSL